MEDNTPEETHEDCVGAKPEVIATRNSKNERKARTENALWSAGKYQISALLSICKENKKSK
jgi:hypothetical protein